MCACSTHTASDLVAYSVAALGLWVAVGLMPPGQQAAGRALLAGGVGGCFCSERWLLGALPGMGLSLTPDGKVGAGAQGVG